MNKKQLLLIPLFLLLPVLVFANVVWPALIAEEYIFSFPIITVSLIIEYFFFKKLFQLEIKKALYYTLVANALSFLLGALVRPLSGLLWELSVGQLVMLVFDWGTFNPITWLSVILLGGIINAFIELLSIRIIWKQKITYKTFFLTCSINMLTIIFAVVGSLVFPPHL